IASQRVRAKRGPMTGSAKQSIAPQAERWMASSLTLLAMTSFGYGESPPARCLENTTRNPTRAGLTSALPGRINGRRTQWEDVMTRQENRLEGREERGDATSGLSRRTLVQGLALGATAAAAGASGALAQNAPAAPPTTITTPPRDFSPRGAPTTYFWDPDIIAVDPSFNNLAQPNTAIKRLYSGVLWAEGPAWSAQGRYLLWSDIPNNRQMRWSEDDGHVSVF